MLNNLYHIGNFFYRFLIKSSKEVYRLKLEAKFKIPKTVNFWHNTFITGQGSISIGEGTYIGQHSYVSANPSDSSIEIGMNCAISHNVQIRTGAYDPELFVQGQRKLKYQDIKIGDNVWIGANVFISGGVKIGNNSIVAANSFVNKSFPCNVIIGGTPAKILKSYD